MFNLFTVLSLDFYIFTFFLRVNNGISSKEQCHSDKEKLSRLVQALAQLPTKGGDARFCS